MNINKILKKVDEQIKKKEDVMQKNPQGFINIKYKNYEFKYKKDDFIIFLIDNKNKYCIGKIIYIYEKNSILTALVKTIELQQPTVVLNPGVMYRIGFASMVDVKKMFINKYEEEIDSNSTVFPLALFCKISDVKQRLIDVFNIDDDYIKNLNIRSVDNYKDKINISTYFQDISPFNMIDKDTIENYFKNYTDFDKQFKELLGKIEISKDHNDRIKKLLDNNSNNLPQIPLSQVLASSPLPPPPPTGSNSAHVNEYANFEEILEIFKDEYSKNVDSMKEKLDNLNNWPIKLNPK
jgi:hypothetical protein